MLKNKNNILIVWTFALLAMIVFSSCNQAPNSSVQQKTTVHYLTVTEVMDEELPVYYSTIGSVISDSRIQITSRAMGYIDEIHVQEGQQVKKGENLISLDRTDIEGAIKQAEAAVLKAQSALEDAKIDFNRYEELFKEDSVPENAFRKIQLQRDVSQQNLNAAKAAYETAKSQRQYILIKSPVDGVVVARQKRAGDLATPGFPIISIESENAFLFKSFVTESQIQKVTQGDNVSVFIDALGTSINGQLLRIVPSGDPVTRTYEIKISLDDTTGILPGMFGRVKFQIGTEISPVIARTAVVERGGLRGVFVLDAEQRAHFRWLRFGREWSDRLQVQVGLLKGEQIVADSVSLVHEGDFVKTGVQ